MVLNKLQKRHVPKRVLLMLACVAAVVIALACCLGVKSGPHIEIRVSEYVDKSDSRFPAAVVTITNNGPVGVLYDNTDPDEPILLRAETATGSVTNVIYVNGVSLPSVLSCGEHIGFPAKLPEGTLRWQLRYTVRRASVRDRAWKELVSLESWDRWGEFGWHLYDLIEGFLSTDEGPPQKFWSEVFEVPDEKTPKFNSGIAPRN